VSPRARLFWLAALWSLVGWLAGVGLAVLVLIPLLYL